MSKRWYVVHTYSGYEKKVKDTLQHRIETMGMQDRIFDIQIPMESVTEIKEAESARPRMLRSSRAMYSSVWRWTTMPGRAFATPRESPVFLVVTANPLRSPAMNITR